MATPALSIPENPSMKDTFMYPSVNTQLYEAQRLLSGNDKTKGDIAYELLRDILKNDRSINEISRKKVQEAADIIESIHFWKPIKKFFNTFRYKERPYIKAQFLLSEAIMDSRLALNESSDSEILFVENLLKNYFFPGHPEKVKINFPSPAEFAFKMWALTEENLVNARIGKPDEDLKEFFERNKKDFIKDTELTEEEFWELVKFAYEWGIDLLTLKEKYSSIERRIKNRYLFESMLLQGIVEPGSIPLDPHLKAFLENVTVKIELGKTKEMSKELQQLLVDNFGDKIIKKSKLTTSIDLSELYDMERRGVQSNLKLVTEKQKDEDSRATLSLVAGVGGEDLSFLRLLQLTAVGLKEGKKIATNPTVVKTVSFIDKLFDKLATFSGAIAGKNKKQKEIVVGGAAKLINMLREGAGGIVKFPSFMYDKIKAGLSTGAGKKLVNAINNNEFIQSGNLMKSLVALSVVAEVVTATVEYRHLESRSDKLDKISETSARVAGTLTYLVPFVGWGAAGIDLVDFVFGTGFETADVYRAISKYAGDKTLEKYGYTETTLMMGELEWQYNIPRHDVKLLLHGAHIQDLEDAETRHNKLFSEMANITLHNMIVIYRSHRQLERGANTDYGEKVFEYRQQYDSNIKTYQKVSIEIEQTLSELRQNNDPQLDLDLDGDDDTEETDDELTGDEKPTI